MGYIVLKALLLPPASFFVLILVGLMLRRWRRRAGTTFAILGLAALYVFSTPVVGTYLLIGLERAGARPGDTNKPAQAIVILSAGVEYSRPVREAETVGSLTLMRLRYGARLHRRTKLPILVTGGGSRDGETPIGELMRDVLTVEFQTPVKWVETQAGTTYENAQNSATQLRKDNIDTIYLVTNSWHMPRAKRVFEQAGLHVQPFGAGYHTMGDAVPWMYLPSARASLNTYYAFHERLGLLWYNWKIGSTKKQ
ncbi:MAG: uncharacterized SAM-binding protein YcdF (DUF218 family) [Alphaproteobacteria bacterium]|jgi:uncharacterized SAM-binding protein YcdF (DUF218 family)